MEDRNKVLSSEAWRQFIGSIQKVCHAKVAKAMPDTQVKEHAIQLLDEIMGRLLLDTATARVEKTYIDSDVKELLESEMRLFCEIVDMDFDQGDPGEATLNNRIEQAKTVKESIDAYVKLPGWLKKTLGILNELLSLIRLI